MTRCKKKYNTPVISLTRARRTGWTVLFLYMVFVIFLGLQFLSMSGYDIPTYKLIHMYKYRYNRVNGKASATMKISNENTPKYVNPHSYNYIILEKHICKRDDDIFLLVVVCVAPARFEHRETIRNTWGSVAKEDHQVRMIFILGKAKDRAIQDKINNESKTFHDIVQEDFADSYRNLSLKSVALLKWVSLYCSHSRYVLKVDDDMFINIKYLSGVLKDRKLTKSILGMKRVNEVPIRDNTSKWYTPTHVYPEQKYPSFVSGTAYVISTDIVQTLFSASLDTAFFWLEDVYLTGICRNKINVSIVNDSGFTSWKLDPSGCTYRNRSTGHGYTLEEIRKIWNELNNKSISC